MTQEQQPEARYADVVHHANVNSSLAYVARKTGLGYQETERLMELALQRGDLASGDYAGRKLHRYVDERAPAIPLAVIEAINAAHGSNEWQGDANAAELLEPACRAIAQLAQAQQERKPLTADALADKCEAWLQSGGASNIVDAFEAGYRDAECAHGITEGAA